MKIESIVLCSYTFNQYARGFKKVSSIIIDGYASTPGTNHYNLILSDKRIESMVSIIRQLGYDKEIKTVPHGENCLDWKKEEQCQRIDMQLFF